MHPSRALDLFGILPLARRGRVMLGVRRAQAGWRDRIRKVDSASVPAHGESALCSGLVGQTLSQGNRTTDQRIHRLPFDPADGVDADSAFEPVRATIAS